MMGMRRIYLKKGFTLIELVVVTLVIAVIAGATITAFNSGFVDEKEETAALYEMTQIRDAILQFQQDNPSFTFSSNNLCSPADASFLFDQSFDNDNDCVRGENSGTPDPDEFSDWDPNYHLGWQGPYMSITGEQLVDIGNDLDHDGTGSPTAGSIITNIVAIADPFTAEPIAPNNNSSAFQWRSISGDFSTNFGRHGRPYLFFDLSVDARARIVSMGPDGVFDGNNGTDVCVGNNDDLVVCLR